MRAELREGAERQILKRVRPVLQSLNTEVSRAGGTMEAALEQLFAAFSHYPSILDQHTLESQVHSLESLIETLYRDACNHTVLLPTKVIVGRAFMAAKLNYLGFLRRLCDHYQQLGPFKDDLQKSWECTIFSLLIEDVYQAILERKDYYTRPVRRAAAIDLIHFWEHRFDRNVSDYAPALVDLWRVRKRVAPVFGTMLGTMELLKISALLTDPWYRFLSAHGENQETVQALEEFIFGLTHESIVEVRRVMRRRHESVIDRETLQHILGEAEHPDDVGAIDPREMYRFYLRRSRQAACRVPAGVPGPRRTLEEMLLAFVIEEKNP